MTPRLLTPRDAQVVRVSINQAGEGYVAGKLRISGGAGSGFAATLGVNASGSAISVLIGNGGVGFVAGDSAYVVRVLHSGTDEAQDGSIASVVQT